MIIIAKNNYDTGAKYAIDFHYATAVERKVVNGTGKFEGLDFEDLKN